MSKTKVDVELDVRRCFHVPIERKALIISAIKAKTMDAVQRVLGDFKGGDLPRIVFEELDWNGLHVHGEILFAAPIDSLFLVSCPDCCVADRQKENMLHALMQESDNLSKFLSEVLRE